jgi:hypothetical protein
MSNINEIVSSISAMTPDEQKALREALGVSGGKPSLKVSEKGAVSFRQIPGSSVRFGLTLYAETLLWLFENQDAVKTFVREHLDTLSWKREAAKARF